MATPARTYDKFPVNVVITSSNFQETGIPIDSIEPVARHNLPKTNYIHTARAIASNNVIYIGVDSSTGPVTAFKESFTEQITDNSGVTRFITTSGKVVAVKRDKSCGCGSRLKNWSIAGTVSLANG